LGAHLGHCGIIEGESLRCNFHLFQYDLNGRCVATGYGTRPPPAARIRTWPVHEQYNTIFLYHDPEQQSPRWSLPFIDQTGWSPLIFHRVSFHGHPQEIAENGFDVGHFKSTHQFSSIKIDEQIDVQKEYITSQIRATRDLKPLGIQLKIEFDVTITGLGFSVSEANYPQVGLRVRQFFFATPTKPNFVEFTTAIAVQEKASTSSQVLDQVLPACQNAALRLAARGMLELIKRDVQKDIEIWKYKRYLKHPALAEGDGPIGLYRKWAKQFYR